MSEFFRALEQARQEREERRAKEASRRSEKAAPATPVQSRAASTEVPVQDHVVAPEAPVPSRQPETSMQSRAAATAEPPVETAEVQAPVVPEPRALRTPARWNPTEVSGRVGDEIADSIDERLVSLLKPNTLAGEQYRTLRHLIEQEHANRNVSVVAISSPGAREGKTITAINLAGSLGQARETKVLIVDADFRRSSLRRQLGLRGIQRPGLAEAIVQGLTLDAVTIDLPTYNVSVIHAGLAPAAPYELLKSPRFGEILAEARARFDYVLVDTPPIVAVPDCRVLSANVDAFLVVVMAHKTLVKALAEALDALDPNKVLGLLYNTDDTMMVRGSYYGYVSVPESPIWSRAIRGMQRLGRGRVRRSLNGRNGTH